MIRPMEREWAQEPEHPTFFEEEYMRFLAYGKEEDNAQA